MAASHTHWVILSQTGTGSHLYEAGLAGRNGISSAILAMHGLTGQPDILEMPRGYLHGVAGDYSFFLQPRVIRTALLEALTK
jgi:2-methylcitrate dehydratase PrpD